MQEREKMRGQMEGKAAGHRHHTEHEHHGPEHGAEGGMAMGRMGMMRGRGHRIGMMARMGMCPMCGRMPAMAELEEGPYRGKGPARRTDEQIKSDTDEVLTEDSWLDASGIQDSVQNGVTTLSGTVDSREAKRRAEDLADQISGVRDVQNNLQIAGP